MLCPQALCFCQTTNESKRRELQRSRSKEWQKKLSRRSSSPAGIYCVPFWTDMGRMSTLNVMIMNKIKQKYYDQQSYCGRIPPARCKTGAADTFVQRQAKHTRVLLTTSKAFKIFTWFSVISSRKHFQNNKNKDVKTCLVQWQGTSILVTVFSHRWVAG